jgi:predicted AAA+ superfamily ATPase
MERQIIEKLLVWKHSRRRKPLLLTGARQVGKTWAMKEFGRRYYDNVAYLSITDSETYQNIFQPISEPMEILYRVQAELKMTITAGNTLIIFDEIQDIPNAINCLKFFKEKAPEYHLIAAGSTLGVMLSQQKSFPVGMVNFLDLHPMNFVEYLNANGENRISEMLTLDQLRKGCPFEEKLNAYVKEYFYVGGMPESVSAFISSHDYVETQEIQKDIINTYIRDFSKYTTANFATKLRMVWDVIPAQLAKENKKFMYGVIKSGARAKEYETQIEWLRDSSLVYKVSKVSKPGYPLKSYEDAASFKLFIHDIGILSAMTELDSRVLLKGSELFTESKGIMAEQYVHQQLLAAREKGIYFWSNENSRTEIDFLIQDQDGNIIPIEVKSGFNLRAKSLKAYQEKYKPPYAIRTSPASFKVDKMNKIIDLPLYAIELLPDVLATAKDLID